MTTCEQIEHVRERLTALRVSEHWLPSPYNRAKIERAEQEMAVLWATPCACYRCIEAMR